MAELKPKRGFVNVEDWHRIGQDRNPVPHIWDERRAVGDDIPVLVVPDPDRDPTPEEIEALAEMIHDAVRPEAESVGGAKLDAWKDAALPYRLVWYMIARSAWKLGSRVPS